MKKTGPTKKQRAQRYRCYQLKGYACSLEGGIHYLLSRREYLSELEYTLLRTMLDDIQTIVHNWNHNSKYEFGFNVKVK